MRNYITILSSLILLFSAVAFNSRGSEDINNIIEDGVIYEVNIRQYTDEGTFNAFAEHLPRLNELGIDIYWFMPIHPISQKNRKGTLGSYYAVQNYKEVNPEFGTKEDFRNIVEQIHKMGKLVIIDWVANHTGFDNVWVESHPEYYVQDSDGNVIWPGGTDWTDVAELNYDNREMREAMIDALCYWVEEFDVDGYRCDVAGLVPIGFWEEAITELRKIKPVFMLAEDWESKELLTNAFDANYGFDFSRRFVEIANGRETTADLDKYFAEKAVSYPVGRFSMNYITNHDENSWHKPVKERFGEAASLFAAYSFIAPGMPLIYSGQEAGLDKSLKFFEKDQIDWTDKSLYPFYQTLTKLKEVNRALDTGREPGSYEIVGHLKSEQVYPVLREKNGDKILAIFNMSGIEVSISCTNSEKLYDIMGGNTKMSLSDIKTIAPWGYTILSSVPVND